MMKMLMNRQQEPNWQWRKLIEQQQEQQRNLIETLRHPTGQQAPQSLHQPTREMNDVNKQNTKLCQTSRSGYTDFQWENIGMAKFRGGVRNQYSPTEARACRTQKSWICCTGYITTPVTERTGSRQDQRFRVARSEL